MGIDVTLFNLLNIVAPGHSLCLLNARRRNARQMLVSNI